MFKRIMIPVDLAHAGKLDRALKVAADLAGHYGAEIVYVGVTGEQPSPVAHNPAEFSDKLSAFARDEATRHGVASFDAHTIAAHDPAVEIDGLLAAAADELGADLVVMGSHIPQRFDLGSHGGQVAGHAHVSVMLVRDA